MRYNGNKWPQSFILRMPTIHYYFLINKYKKEKRTRKRMPSIRKPKLIVISGPNATGQEYTLKLLPGQYICKAGLNWFQYMKGPKSFYW